MTQDIRQDRFIATRHLAIRLWSGWRAGIDLHGGSAEDHGDHGEEFGITRRSVAGSWRVEIGNSPTGRRRTRMDTFGQLPTSPFYGVTSGLYWKKFDPLRPKADKINAAIRSYLQIN
jgi:hypothetical protein